MLYIARIITCLFLALIAFLSFNLGMDYITINQGLHPAIAFPIAALSILTIGYFLSWKIPYHDYEEDEDYLVDLQSSHHHQRNQDHQQHHHNP